MTYLKRAMMEHPDMDPKALVLFHCPFDFDLPLTACPDAPKGSLPEGAVSHRLTEGVTPPTLCYLCWNLEVPE